MACDFCADGECLLCQIRAPREIGASSVQGRGIDIDCEPAASRSGGHRTSERVRGRGVERQAPILYRESPMCPICRERFKDLYHHYSKHHPGERLELPGVLRSM